MFDSNQLLVLAHPVLAAISSADIDRAIPESSAIGIDYVEITPLRTTLDEQYDINWPSVHEAQERLFVEKLRPHLEGREQLAYFGFAPIPLAIHLGYRVQSAIKIDVYQRHHRREDWVWAQTGKASTRSFLEPIRLPQRGSFEPGAVVIRVSTSYRIAPEDTEQVVPQPLAAVDIALVSPGLDALETRGALDSVVDAFSQAFARLRDLFPNITAVHLFAAVPVGLAFRLGSRINPTIYPEVVTYQYTNRRSPRYRKAIVLGAHPAPAEAVVQPKERLPWPDKELITADRETFLDIWFLDEGVRMAQSVVCLRVYSEKGVTYSGTGFLIAPSTILTNHHVLYDHKDDFRRMRKVDIWFKYELDQTGQLHKVDVYEGDVETIQGDDKYDWAIIRPKAPVKDGYRFFELRPSKPVEVGDCVYIIQHPAGRPKKIGLVHNNVIDVTSEQVQYLTDTLPGSSGSPVCNEFWQVVALHSAGIDQSPKGKTRCRNEGIHIDRVVEGLKARGIIE